MEELKSLDEVTTVDRRNTYFVLRNRVTGETRPQELKGHYESVDGFVLSETAPEKVQSHFNTAKNVLLYTWFAYGLFPVAELQALNALELALKERIGEDGLKTLKKQLKKTGKGLGLQSYIEHAAASKPAGSGLELTHFAIESATELLSVLPCLCVARRQAKPPNHHSEDFKHSFRVDDRIRLVLRPQHDPAAFAVQPSSTGGHMSCSAFRQNRQRDNRRPDRFGGRAINEALCCTGTYECRERRMRRSGLRSSCHKRFRP